MMTKELLEKFKYIFYGNKNGYGQHAPEKGLVKEGEKVNGKSWTEKKILEISQYEKHLRGETGLGLVPIDNNGLVKWIAIDIDNYNPRYTTSILQKIFNNNLPFHPFRSKSGGLHLYMFFKELIAFKSIKENIDDFLPVLGLKSNIEIFPKQQKLKEDQIGNWINLPYFGNANTVQYLFDKNMRPLELDAALTTIENSLLDKETFLFHIEKLSFNDAPPCLQTIYYNGDCEMRNEFLFGCATYFKTKFKDDFEEEINKLNKEMNRPLEQKELDHTVINSHKKKDYSYKCSQLPCSDFCNKDLCVTRKYGIGQEDTAGLKFEDFIQYGSDPPYYEWTINGKILMFNEEAEIIAQNKFRELCLRYLHILPQKLREKSWTNIINRALKNVIVKEVNIEDDISMGSIFLNHLYEFFENRIHAENITQILIKRVFKDELKETYVFKSKDLLEYLYDQANFKGFKISEIHSRLKRMGAITERLYIDKNNQGIRVWRLGFKAISSLKVVTNEVRLDFTEYKEIGNGEY